MSSEYEKILQSRIERWGVVQVRDAAKALSLAYREGKGTNSLRMDPDLFATAYLASRFPSTRAVACRIAREIEDRLHSPVRSLLDLGAGCGATTVGCLEVWPEIEALTALEREPGMVSLGRQILPGATWRSADFRKTDFGPHELVIFGYSLGEAGQEPLEKAWHAAGKLLAILEPGTTRGFVNIRRARDWLIGQGAAILAPCPSNGACPIQGQDWCHFAERVNRSKTHKLMKGGTLGYEDEKYSYLVAAKQALSPGLPRVLRHPRIEPGVIHLDLCMAPARVSKTIRKREKQAFLIARKLKWGDGAAEEWI